MNDCGRTSSSSFSSAVLAKEQQKACTSRMVSVRTWLSFLAKSFRLDRLSGTVLEQISFSGSLLAESVRSANLIIYWSLLKLVWFDNVFFLQYWLKQISRGQPSFSYPTNLLKTAFILRVLVAYSSCLLSDSFQTGGVVVFSVTAVCGLLIGLRGSRLSRGDGSLGFLLA